LPAASSSLSQQDGPPPGSICVTRSLGTSGMGAQCTFLWGPVAEGLSCCYSCTVPVLPLGTQPCHLEKQQVYCVTPMETGEEKHSARTKTFPSLPA
jgi:hypothetical protein